MQNNGTASRVPWLRANQRHRGYNNVIGHELVGHVFQI